MKRIATLSCFFSLLAPFSQADTVNDIDFEGLQRVSIGTARNAVGLEEGDRMSPKLLADSVRRLYKTGYFTEIEVFQDDTKGQVVFKVIEQPAISTLEFEGNRKIDSDILKQIFKDSRLEENEVLNRGALEQIVSELERQYSSMGLYNAKVEVEVTPLPRNRVDLVIDIEEGKPASIANIDIVGNQVFSDEEIKDDLNLSEKQVGSLFSSSHNYSSEVARADQEKLKAYYLDRGYLKFELVSTQVSIGANKKDIFLSYNVFEGDPYYISSVNLAGELVGDEKKLQKLLTLEKGALFSRKEVTAIQQALQARLGALGYAFAKISVIPKPDDENKTVDITYFIEPGKRTYIRRVQITGNKGTDDEVLRREVVQMEGALASSNNIGASKRRLERSGYYEQVQVTTPQVPGADDQIDMNINVKEGQDGQLTGTMGYEDPGGFFVSAEYGQKNFAGTGKDVTAKVVSNEVENEFTASYTDPFFTLDGVSLSWDVFYTESDYSDILDDDSSGRSRIGIDEYGGNATFGYPISNDERLNYGLGYQNTNIIYKTPDWEIQNFIDQNGSSFDTFLINAGYSYNTLNGSNISATDGTSHRIRLNSSVPGSELEYYKLTYTTRFYQELYKGYVLRLRGELGYGSHFGNSNVFPFFENFLVGGAGSLRGYQYGSVGPKTTPQNSGDSDSSFGGNMKALYGFDLYFPMPLVGDSNMFTPSIFVDAGAAFTEYCVEQNTGCEEGVNWEDVRYSYGFELAWVTPIAPLRFIWGWPVDQQEGDELQRFTFTFGYSF